MTRLEMKPMRAFTGVDRLGPQVGETVPLFSLTDQHGAARAIQEPFTASSIAVRLGDAVAGADRGGTRVETIISRRAPGRPTTWWPRAIACRS